MDDDKWYPEQTESNAVVGCTWAALFMAAFGLLIWVLVLIIRHL